MNGDNEININNLQKFMDIMKDIDEMIEYY